MGTTRKLFPKSLRLYYSADMLIVPNVSAIIHIKRDAFYTSLWNALDYAACTFPVTTVDPALDTRVPRHHFHNHEDEHVYRWCKCPESLLCQETKCLHDSSHLQTTHMFSRTRLWVYNL